MTDSGKSFWLGFVTPEGVRSVEDFQSSEAAMAYRQRVKHLWAIPARITIAFQASSREEALEIMDRY